MSKTKLRQRQIRVELKRFPQYGKYAKAQNKVGFEPEPPNCSNCLSYERYVEVSKDKSPQNRPIQEHNAFSWCSLNNFTITYGGICDLWHGDKGATLEP